MRIFTLFPILPLSHWTDAGLHLIPSYVISDTTSFYLPFFLVCVIRFIDLFLLLRLFFSCGSFNSCLSVLVLPLFSLNLFLLLSFPWLSFQQFFYFSFITLYIFLRFVLYFFFYEASHSSNRFISFFLGSFFMLFFVTPLSYFLSVHYFSSALLSFLSALFSSSFHF